ncbi:O-acetyl-ADP-ribose deacetylase [Aphis craccivora]|uniref:O-acetyl-ADP-ribose deacetylase n=1 Tax=Aphis craccivora TaxID=307492 RepID=A0A6G0VP98_APHCR|nr:O-acetyl-ADP-ribose deacetylase [Aphis craccivora]
MYLFRNTDIEIIICSKFEISDDEKLIIFKQCHDSKIGGHVGLKEDKSCQKGKVANIKVKQPMLITSTSSEPFEKIFLDIVGPLVTTLSAIFFIIRETPRNTIMKSYRDTCKGSNIIQTKHRKIN